MIGIVDYGMGNLHSVRNALDMIGAEVEVISDPADLANAERIILPGVGAFGKCVDNLRDAGFEQALRQEVLEKGKPFYGICVGMQVLAQEGSELGTHAGLGWLPAKVQKLEPADSSLKVPHVGWNEIVLRTNSDLFRGIKPDATFYFVHSYHMVVETQELEAADCEYGSRFTAAVLYKNIFATQFHPEKSQQNGLRLLENFVNWNPKC